MFKSNPNSAIKYKNNKKIPVRNPNKVIVLGAILVDIILSTQNYANGLCRFVYNIESDPP